MAMFGPEIHAAITESPIRARELAEGKNLTECISMVVTGSEMTIKLAMDIRGSVQICSKLYTYSIAQNGVLVLNHSLSTYFPPKIYNSQSGLTLSDPSG